MRGGWVAGVVWLVGRVAAATANDDAIDWRDHVTVSASLRTRGELVDWFRPPAGVAHDGAERYAFFASQLRVGVRAVFPHLEVGLDVQDTRLTGLPDDATLPPPQGSLGPGAVYFLHTHDTTQGEPFVKQAFVSLRRGGVAATAGRFDYRDGLETVPADATLATVKRTRIAERLVGPFEFTHVTRSFDGVRVVLDRTLWNATAIGARPTQGGFEVSANRELDVWLAGLALTLKRLPVGPPLDARLFYLFYDDERTVAKVDNGRDRAGRPAPQTGTLAIHTIGAHAISAFDAGPGTVDLLAWAAGQGGHWGDLRHSAWAYALEAGYQLPRLPAAPWLRAGIDRASGDASPADRTHGTFFQLLPTARIYAQLPFFNLMNAQDLFAMLVLQPHPLVTVRADHHWLRLTSRTDLWYSGGGASNDDVFGYAGAPAGGRRDLARLADLSVTLALCRQVTLAGYYGHAFGGGVVGASFAGRDADYGFVEMTLRY